MRVALYVISILWIVLGTLLIIYTESTKGFLKKLFYTEHIRLLAILPVLFGLILGIGAFYIKEMFWLAITLGIMAIIKGVYLFIGPSHQIKRLFEWWFNRAEDRTIRLFGLITYTLGGAILSFLI